MDLSCDYLKMKHPIAQKALYALLEVKDSDLRLDTVYQGNHAVDQGIHIGGTFSELSISAKGGRRLPGAGSEAGTGAG